MITANSETKLNLKNLTMQVDKMHIMKWILDIEENNDEFTLNDLQNQIDLLCYENITHLIVLSHYINQLSPKVYNFAKKIISAKNKGENYQKLYLSYLKSCKTEAEFKEFETYIYIHRGQEALLDVDDEGKYSNMERYIKIKQMVIHHKSAQLALLFNVLENSSLKFEPIDILENIPQLLNWVEEFKSQPIQKLTDDECEILAGYSYQFNCEQMLTQLNLSNDIKDYVDINKIRNALPAKFGVYNMTQVMFRIILLKPYIWQQGDHKNIVSAIKGICNEVCPKS